MATHQVQLFSTESNPQRRRSFTDIQGFISKINPQMLKSVIANVSVPSTPNHVHRMLPVCDPTLKLSSSGYEENPKTGEMTIFYNGMLYVFDVSPQKAQEILKFAEEEEGFLKSASGFNSFDPQNLLENHNGDLPLARRKSLHRFLEKRKKRLTNGVPLLMPPPTFYKLAR